MLESTANHLDDATCAAFVDGSLAAEAFAAVELHIDGCAPCRGQLAAVVRLRSSAAEPDEPRDRSLLPPGSMLGRYEVLEVLGVGATGVVYAVHDRQLDREIALKVVRSSASAARLLVEAQALAKLRHDNVVAIHDVIADGDRACIAMELVRGETLGAWLAARPRTAHDIVGVFAQAGRGLAAAHDAGLVHRDFKPDNVLVGDDGRVCVTDFGLARTGGPPAIGNGDSLVTTRAGALIGTPAYMAPEQHRGEVADARADQFAFGVALFEALAGRRPFGGATLDELRVAVLAGAPRWPTDRRLPRRLHRVLARCLRPHVDARYPTMHALLDELAPRTRGRRLALAGAAVAIAAIVAIVALRGGDGPACDFSRALGGTWDPDRRATIAAALGASNVPYAVAARDAVTGELDRYAARWIAVRTEVCEAQRRDEMPPRTLELEVGCLDRRARELDALVRVLATADAAVAKDAARAAHSLSSSDDCSDGATLIARASPRVPPGVQARLDAIADRLAVARAQIVAGKHADARATLDRALAEARAAADRRLEAEALVLAGTLAGKAASFADAERALSDAVIAAEATGRDDLRAMALIRLAQLAGVRLRRGDDGQRFSRQAAAVVERLAGEPSLAIELAYTDGLLAGQRGDYTAEVARFQAALALVGRHPDAMREADLVDRLGMALYDLGKLADALVQVQRGLAMRERLYGRDHPLVAQSLNSVAATLAALDRNAEAVPYAERALAIAERTYGADHPDVAAAVVQLAGAHRAIGDARAEAEYRRALAIMEHAFGPSSPNLANALHGLAYVARDRGDLAAAQQLVERSLAIGERTLGKNHPELAPDLDALADLAIRNRDYATAVRLGERALALPDDDPEAFAPALIATGHAHVLDGHADRGVPLLDKAVALLAHDGEASMDLAEARFDLAQGLRALGQRDRARELAGQAAVTYQHAPRAERQLAEVQAFLAEKP
jgi:serine/threonine protein kinase